MILQISDEITKKIVNFYNNHQEYCGIFFYNDIGVVLDVVLLPNRTTGNTARSFQIDPVDIERVLARKVIGTYQHFGFFHTHPEGMVNFSYNDLSSILSSISYPDVSMHLLICVVKDRVIFVQAEKYGNSVTTMLLNRDVIRIRRTLSMTTDRRRCPLCGRVLRGRFSSGCCGHSTKEYYCYCGFVVPKSKLDRYTSEINQVSEKACLKCGGDLEYVNRLHRWHCKPCHELFSFQELQLDLEIP